MGLEVDQRGVSEVVASALIIGITIALAVFVVGLAGTAIQAIGEESRDSLTRSSFQEMADRVDGLSASQVDTAASVRFPQGAGASVASMPQEGNVTITASVANPAYQSQVIADQPTNSTTFTIGTIVSSDRTDNTLVYQGGGLWEYTGEEHATLRSRPPFDYDGGRVDFQFVDLSDLQAISEGEAIRVTKRTEASSAISDAIRENLSAQWTVDAAAGYTVAVDVNVTIESQYAYGWKQYAEEGMSEPLDSTDVIYRSNDGEPDLRPNVTMVFEGVGNSDLPDYPEPILYAGDAARASQLYDPLANGSIGAGAADSEIEISPESGPHHEKQQLAFYNETGEEWVIHWRNNAHGPPTTSNKWYNVSESIVSGDAVHTSATGPAEIDGFTTDGTGAGNYTYEFAPGHADTKICVVSYATQADFPDNGTVQSLERCVASMDVSDRGRYMPTELAINQTSNVTDAVIGEPETVQVDVVNNGSIDSNAEHDVGLYREVGGELLLADYNTSGAIGTIPAGENVTLNMTWTPRNTSTDALHAVVGAHDADSQTVSVQGRTLNLTVNVTEETAASVARGSRLEVNASVNNTGNAAITNATVVLREERGTPADDTEITLDPGQATNVSLYWDAPLSAFSETLRVQALNANDTHDVTDAGSADFDVSIDAVDGPAASNQPLNVTATIENDGTAAGTQEVVLIADTERVDDLITDTATVTDLGAGNDTTRTFTWDSPVDPVRGNNRLIVRTRDHSTSTEFDVAANYDVEIEKVEPDSVSGDHGAKDVTVTANVTNVGDEDGSQALALGVPNSSDLELRNTGAVHAAIDGGDSATVTLSGKVIPPSLTGNLSVASAEDRDRARVVVRRSGPNCDSVTYNGTGTSTLPYEISSVDQLQCLDRHVADGTDTNSTYVLTEDIDAYGTEHWNGGAGFEPIGDQRWRGGDHFEGDLDGQGHSIEGLTIDRPDESFVGIFALTHDFENSGVGVGVTVENMNLVDVDVHGKTVVGGLVGGAGGSIERISVSGRVESQYQQVGGLVGHAHDADLNNELVSTATVTGTYPAALDGEHPWYNNDQANLGIGGIVGGTGFNTDVATAYSRATVTGNSGVGGITGWTSDFASTNEQMYWVDGHVERTGPWRLDEMDRANLSAPENPTAGAIAGRMEVTGDTFKNSVYSDENYPSIGEQKADASAISLSPSEMTGPQVLPDSEAEDYPGITENDTEGTMANLNWSIWEPVYDIDETGAVVNEGYPIFEWQVDGQFVVDDISAPETVTEGQTVTVNATIVNTKTESDTQDVRLFNPDGNPVAVTETTLGAGNQTTVTLEWRTYIGDNTTGLSDPKLTVRTADSGNAHAIDVLPQEPPIFDIEAIEDPDDVTELERVDVNVTVNNTGGSGDRTVFLEHNGTIRNSTTVSLGADADTDVTLSWYTQVGDAGENETLTVKTGGDQASTEVTVSAANLADFSIGNVTFPAYGDETPVLTAGESLTATVNVSNEGGHTGEELVWLTPAGSNEILNHSVTELDPSEHAEFNLTWETSSPDVDVLEVHVEGGDTVAEQIVVRESATEITADPISVDISKISVTG